MLDTLDALCISDLQIPAEHRDALDFCLHVKKVWFPGIEPVIVNMGDEVDQHSLGRWPSDPDGRSGGDELKESKLRLSYWFDAFPRVFVCTSNHTYRAWKNAFLSGIPSEFVKTVAEVYQAPVGWKWRDRWISHGICFEHGENVSGIQAAINAARQNHMNTAIGHIHTFGGVIHADSISGKLWGLNTGCLIDIENYAFKYGRSLRNKPTLGCGVIKNGVPYFVPMITDGGNRWTGQA